MGNMQSNIADVKVVELLNGNRLKPESRHMKEIYNRVNQYVEEGKLVRLDFSGAGLSAIYTDDKFKELLVGDKFQGVYMRFKGEEQLVQTLRLLLTLSGRDEERVCNVENTNLSSGEQSSVFTETSKSRSTRIALEENGVEVVANEQKIVIHYTNWNGKTVLSSMSTVFAVIGLYNAVVNQLKATGYTRADIDFGSLTVGTRSDSVGDMLQVAKNSLTDLGYTVLYKFDNKATEKQWNTAVIMSEAPKTVSEILSKVDSYLKSGTVGMLSEYVPAESRRDRLGRVGKGKVATRQPAIYLGHTEDTVKFRRYNGTKFLRRADWDRKLMQDAEYLIDFGEVPLEEPVFNLSFVDMEIPIDKVGICKFSYGTHYHYSLPVHGTTAELVKCWAYNKTKEKFEEVRIPLPVFLELVLDENNEDYNVDELQNCIEFSEHQLRSNEVELANLDDYDFDRRG